MCTKSRQTIYGGAIMGAEIRARSARETAKKAAREADRAEWMLLKAASSVGAKTASHFGQRTFFPGFLSLRLAWHPGQAISVSGIRASRHRAIESSRWGRNAIILHNSIPVKVAEAEFSQDNVTRGTQAMRTCWLLACAGEMMGVI